MIPCTKDVSCCFFFIFKQKTAYELRISDWSSDVCSSDLLSPACCAVCPAVKSVTAWLKAAICSGVIWPAAGAACAASCASAGAASGEIGRASRREKECQDEEISAVAV